MPGASNPAGMWGCKHGSEKAAGLACKANPISRVFIQQQEEMLPTLIFFFLIFEKVGLQFKFPPL